jgi:hypothetical protein
VRHLAATKRLGAKATVIFTIVAGYATAIQRKRSTPSHVKPAVLRAVMKKF